MAAYGQSDSHVTMRISETVSDREVEITLFNSGEGHISIVWGFFYDDLEKWNRL